MIQLAGTHLGASTSEGEFEVPTVRVVAPGLPLASTVVVEPVQLAIGQPLDLVGESSDFLPEVENFDVVLKKDSQGLGITIAGYVCEKGIFTVNLNLNVSFHL